MCDVLDLIDAQVTDQARPVILVDGRSGAGKTTLATQLAARHPGWQLVHADDIYPGWMGLSGVWDLASLWNPEPSYLSWASGVSLTRPPVETGHCAAIPSSRRTGRCGRFRRGCTSPATGRPNSQTSPWTALRRTVNQLGDTGRWPNQFKGD